MQMALQTMTSYNGLACISLKAKSTKKAWCSNFLIDEDYLSEKHTLTQTDILSHKEIYCYTVNSLIGICFFLRLVIICGHLPVNEIAYWLQGFQILPLSRMSLGTYTRKIRLCIFPKDLDLHCSLPELWVWTPSPYTKLVVLVSVAIWPQSLLLAGNQSYFTTSSWQKSKATSQFTGNYYTFKDCTIFLN